MVRDIGNAVLEILHPVAPTGSALNDASIVTKISCGKLVLLPGDIEKRVKLKSWTGVPPSSAQL